METVDILIVSFFAICSLGLIYTIYDEMIYRIKNKRNDKFKDWYWEVSAEYMVTNSKKILKDMKPDLHRLMKMNDVNANITIKGKNFISMYRAIEKLSNQVELLKEE